MSDTTAARTWSEQQTDIFDWFKHPLPKSIVDIDPTRPTRSSSRNLCVIARAGCGKTTTIIEAIRHAPEANILVAAFNKRIQQELERKLTTGNAEALTLHALGNKFIADYWPRMKVDARVRGDYLTDTVVGQQTAIPLRALVTRLHRLARETRPLATMPADLSDLAIDFECVPGREWEVSGFDLEWITARAFECMTLAANDGKRPDNGVIDYADQIFLPLANKWLRPKYDMVVVDEAQDMTETQLALARGVCAPDGRIVIVGDDRQAIYGFRGADSDCLGRLRDELRADVRYLTGTYRCGAAIVNEAQAIVPDFEALGAHDGAVERMHLHELYEAARPGDFVLARKNAPIAGVAMGLIRRGVPARIEGRDIGEGLIRLVDQLAKGAAANSIPLFLQKLDNWKDRETTRAIAAKREAKADQIADQYETILAITDGARGVPEIRDRLVKMFPKPPQDEKQAEWYARAFVVCSSVHKAKGLERDTVYALADTFMLPVPCLYCGKRPAAHRGGFSECAGYAPDPDAEKEEQNIKYVAITRAIHRLVWVDGEPKAS